jgi:lysozyme family protein
MTYEDCLKKILVYEGGYSNHPLDKGGETNLGITQHVYDRYRDGLVLPRRSVKYIERSEISVIYWKGYWVPCKCGELPSPLDLIVFDCSVLHGPSKAIKILQKIVGVEVDGIIGSKTLEAIKAIGSVKDVCSSYLEARENHFRDIVKRDPEQVVFLKGWLNRLSHLRAYLE